jgi:drug/metabolite transporter (DMT)-like permease
MSQRHSHLDALAIGMMVLFSATWGLNQVAAKVANDSISPLLQAGLRSAGAALLLYLWCVMRRIPLFGRDGSLRAGILAGLLFGGEFGFIFWGLQYTTASRGVLFLYTSPFVVAAGLHWLVPSERLRPFQIAGLGLAFAGVFAAFVEGLHGGRDSQWIGDAMMFIAAILWGASTVVVRSTVLSRVGASKTLLYQLAVSATGLLLASWLAGEQGFTNPTALGWASLAWQTVVVAFASYLGWFWLIAHYPATRLAAFSFLTPLFGIAFGAILLGEHITPLLGVALVLVAFGLWLVNRRPAVT